MRYFFVTLRVRNRSKHVAILNTADLHTRNICCSWSRSLSVARSKRLQYIIYTHRIKCTFEAAEIRAGQN